MWSRRFSVLFFALLYSVVAFGEDNEPSLRVIPKSTVYNVGEKKAIYCEGMNLKERIEWYSPSKAMVGARTSKNNRVYVERMKNDSLIPIIIQSAQLEDSGNWTCRSGELSETIEILVGEKVYLKVRNQTIDGEEGKPARLSCEARGSPAPVVQWYKDMVPISAENRAKYIMKEKAGNYQLEIRNLNHLDSGEYVCKVTQEALSHYTDKRYQLVVQHKPLLVDQPIQEENMYITKYKTQEIYAILNETKNISCNTIANPPPEFEWHRRKDGFDERIPDGDTIAKSEDGMSSVLTLRMYDETYLGEYKCSAKNSKGSVSIIFHVTLGNKPEPPDSVTVINSTVSDILFNVTCSSCPLAEDSQVAEQPENLRVLGYSFQLTPVVDGYVVPDWDSESAVEIPVDIYDPDDTLFSVGPLQNSTSFYTRVRSRNAAGFSEWLVLEEHPSTTSSGVATLPSLVVALCYFVAVFVILR